MVIKILEKIKTIVQPIELLEEKINKLKDHKEKMAWDDYEKAHQEVLEEMDTGLELLDEAIVYLEENEANLDWDTFDGVYDVLLESQTYLVGKKAEYSRDLLKSYSEQLEELEQDEGNIVWNVTENIGRLLWSSIKKGTNYLWENKGELYDKLIEKGGEEQDKIRRRKSSMESLVDRQSVEEVKRNLQTIYQKHQSGETISIEDEFYVQAAKKKIENAGY